MSLGHTKTGRRQAAYEASVILDSLVGRIYSKMMRSTDLQSVRRRYIFPGSLDDFYTGFNEAIVALGLQEIGFRMYSLRRGGATAFFRKTRSMEAALDRGRWGSSRVARVYLNDGLAREVEINLQPTTVEYLRARGRQIHALLE